MQLKNNTNVPAGNNPGLWVFQIHDGVYCLFADVNFDGIIDEMTELLTDMLLANVDYVFDGDGFSLFRIGGIETDAGLDPTDVLAFITTLTFSEGGIYQITQTPLIEDIDDGGDPPTPVSAPGGLGLLLLGLASLGLRRRRAPA